MTTEQSPRDLIGDRDDEGIPPDLFVLLGRILLSLPETEKAAWDDRFRAAIRPGADLSPVASRLADWAMNEYTPGIGLLSRASVNSSRGKANFAADAATIAVSQATPRRKDGSHLIPSPTLSTWDPGYHAASGAYQSQFFPAWVAIAEHLLMILKSA